MKTLALVIQDIKSLGWRNLWPWAGCAALLLLSAAVDVGQHLFQQAFRCPPVVRGTLVARPQLPAQLLKSYVEFDGKSPRELQIKLGISDTSRWLLDRRGTNAANEGVLVLGSIKNPDGTPNPSGIALASLLATQLQEKSFSRSVRVVALADISFGIDPSHYQKWDHARATLWLGKLSDFSPTPQSQDYPNLFRWFYPSQGDFVAFIGSRGGKGLCDVSSSLFRRYSRLGAQCFKPLPVASAALSTQDLGYPSLQMPYTLLTDTEKWRPPTNRIDLNALEQIYLGLMKTVEGLANDSNPADPIAYQKVAATF